MLSNEEKDGIRKLFQLPKELTLKSLRSLKAINLYHYKSVIEYVCNQDFKDSEMDVAMESLLEIFKDNTWIEEEPINVDIPQDKFLSFLKGIDHDVNNKKSRFELVKMLKGISKTLSKDKLVELIFSIESEMEELETIYLMILKDHDFMFEASKYKKEENMQELIKVIANQKYEHSDKSLLNKTVIAYIEKNKESLIVENPYCLLNALTKLNYRISSKDVPFYFEHWFSFFKSFNESKTEEDLMIMSPEIKNHIDSYRKVKIKEEGRLSSIVYETAFKLLTIFFTLFNEKNAYFALKNLDFSNYKIQEFHSEVTAVPLMKKAVPEQPFEINEVVERIGSNLQVNELLLFSILQKINMPYMKDIKSEYISYMEGGKSALRSYMTTEEFILKEDNPSASIINYLHQDKLIKLLPKNLLMKLMTDFPHINFHLKNAAEDSSFNQSFFKTVYDILDENMQINLDDYDLLILEHKI